MKSTQLEDARKARVLVVDDVAGHRETLADYLSAKGYEVVTAADGASAVKMTKEQPADVAVLDVKLPDISGEKLAVSLNGLSPGLEIILISGYASLESALKAVQSPVSAYLTKPLDMGRLITELEKAVEHRRLVLSNRRLIEELKSREERLAGIIDSVTDYMTIEDDQHNIVWANEVAGRSFGPALVGEKCYKVFHGRDEPCAQCYVEETFADLESHENEREVTNADGNKRLIWSKSSVVASHEDGRPKMVLAISRDITERNLLEKQLRHVQKMEAVGTLASGLAHDFNNILAGIIGYTSLMKKMLKDNPAAADLEAIERLTWRGADITKGLLAFSRKGEYQPELRNINFIIEEVLKVIGRTSGGHLEIKAELSPDTQNVRCDRGQIHQAFMNLFINACDAMPENGVLTVKTGNADLDEAFFRLHANMKAGPHIFLTISDTGTGMDEETRERIFEPFFTTKDEKSGTGLGLAMVIGIIEGHGGCIDVASEPERGSTFTVYLPAAEGEVEKEDSEPPGRLRGGETILLADDEEDFRKSVGRALEELGYTVIGAADGEEAVRLLEEKKDEVDLVLLDMIIKGIGGAETFERLREIVPDLAVIICSGFTLDSSCKRVLKAGGKGFIQKPFKHEVLALRVREVLDSR